MDNETREWLIRPGGLASRLRQIREDAGLSAAALARSMKWDRTRVSKVEHGHSVPPVPIIRAWAAACGQPDAVDGLIDLLPGRAQHQDYQERLREGHAVVQADWDQLIRESKTVFDLQLACAPGLLQTPDYARTVMLASLTYHGGPTEGIDQAIAARIERQRELGSTEHEFAFVIFEAALKVLVGDPNIMIAQIDRIRTLAGLPHVTVAIMPLGAPLTLLPLNPFIAIDGLVRCETFGGLVTIEPGPEAQKYVKLIPQLLRQSVTGEAADRILMSAMRWWSDVKRQAEEGAS